ncbi:MULTISPECIES: AbrB/MazE/SpoVT family DNA-binding domain-containing protein [unclassified Aureimonas]|uniref:AbrB/MazE/SpoVT family DNA-binding domain-containing protein n=1 Tax=unclassified Aureimonas TaxID=2615206 RepID=UPI0006F3640D|nr:MULTISPECIES: AbrB/MazE/SpoVT family DNA-binding domain-containing protein [unclassified Aureimonas]KQT55148.1 sporulation regulator [Aureimonas sp. Leaf427]KQT70937.1 sporulation regulator [Aureimonas sp. Leaf460]
MRVTEKGQVTIPKPIRDKLGIGPGSEVQFVERGDVVLLKAGGASAGADLSVSFDEWASAVAGTLDLDGRTTDEHMDWLRGPRDDLDPR